MASQSLAVTQIPQDQSDNPTDSHRSLVNELQRKPNDCVVCGSILHELDAQQCHTRPNVKCGGAGLPISGV